MGKKESKKNDKPAEATTVQNTEPKKRYEVVDRKLVLDELEKLKKSTEGNERERADRLSSYYAHEAQQGKIKLADCQPDDASDPTGCWFRSDAALDACPFCGKGGPVVPMPIVPKADRDIELNVKAAETKLVKPEGLKPEVVKVKSKTIKEKKKERGEQVLESKPTEVSSVEPKSDAIVPAKPEAIDLPSEIVSVNEADAFRIERDIEEATDRMLVNQALSMWELGTLLAEARDKKIWLIFRHDNGGYKYQNFNTYVAQRFDYTPDHAGLMMRIATSMTKEQSIIGSAKAKAILDARLPDDMTSQLLAWASERDGRGNFVHSLVELRVKIKHIKEPQLTTGTSPTAVRPSDADDCDDDLDADDEDNADDEDDSDDEDEPKSVRSASSKSAQPKMTSISFEAREFSLPLVQKGSQIKAAKKIQDEPHGSLQVPGGAKIHFVIRIGDEGQFFLDGRIETPY